MNKGDNKKIRYTFFLRIGGVFTPCLSVCLSVSLSLSLSLSRCLVFFFFSFSLFL